MSPQGEPRGWDARAERARLAGPLVTVLVVLLVEVLAQTLLAGRLPLLGMGYALALGAVVYAAATGGLLPGVLSGVGAGAYAFYYYSTHLAGVFPVPADRQVLGAGVGVFTLGLAVLVARVKTHTDALQRRALLAEQAHSAQLEAKNAQLAQANAALAEANEALEAFSYVVSHDLKEPVRAIHAFSRALEEDHGQGLPAEARDLAHRNVETSARLSRLIGGLLDYSRMSRIDRADLQPLRVEESLASPECVTRFEHLLEERHARLVVTPGPAVLASPAALAQVLGNLVLNALRHNLNAKPVVKVSSATWREDPDLVEVVVEDNGPGFPPHVLTRFAQLKHDRPSTVRGGFGLLIARHAVEKLGGTMRLGRSEELGGAAVRFTLPAAGAPVKAQPVEEAVRAPGPRDLAGKR